MRIIKSAVGVALCCVIYIFRGDEANLFDSMIAMLWCIQPYTTKSLDMGVQRTTGTVIGGVSGLIFVMITKYMFPVFFENSIAYYALVSFMVIPVIYSTTLMHKKDSSFFSTVVFLAIVVAHVDDTAPIRYVFNRILDTLIGVFAGIFVNAARIPRKKRRDTLFAADLDRTLINEGGEISPFSKVELNRLIDDGANITVTTMHTPAYIFDVVGDINWKLPLVVMDGAALYDTQNRRFVYTVNMDHAHANRLLEFFSERRINCFVNVIIDGVLITCYRELQNEAEQKIFEDLRKSPYRNYVNTDLSSKGSILHLMSIGKKEKMEKVFGELKAEGFDSELKILCYDAHDYPGYTYIKIYNKNATRDNLILKLKKTASIPRLVTIGDDTRWYDVAVTDGDENRAVRAIEKLYEPYFWKKSDLEKDLKKEKATPAGH